MRTDLAGTPGVLMAEKRNMKLCVGASAGGHMSELLKLLERVDQLPCRPSFSVTTLSVAVDRLKEFGTVYVIGECNRWHPLRAVRIFLRGFRLILKERPDVILTTGSFPLALVCLSAKLLGAKIIWIDSIASTEKLSMSGRLIRPVADLIFSQWVDVAAKYGNVEYHGAVV
jgi:hypothetical protein